MKDGFIFFGVVVVWVTTLMFFFPIIQRKLSATLPKAISGSYSPGWHPIVLLVAAFSIVLAGHGLAIVSCKLWVSSCQYEVAIQSTSAFGVLSHATDLLIISITEELVFRGFLLEFLARRMKVTSALRLQAALFAVIHPMAISGLSLISVVPYYLFGLCLGYVAVRDTTLLRSCVAHIGFNLSLVFLSTTALGLTVPNSLFVLQIGPFAWLLGGAYWVSTVVLLFIFVRYEKTVFDKVTGPGE